VYEAHFTRGFAAAHRLHEDPSKCSRLHGHNYQAELVIRSDRLHGPGFVVHFDLVKAVVDRYDHRTILCADDPIVDDGSVLGIPDDWLVIIAVPPTAENLAQLLAWQIAERTIETYGGGVTVECTLREGPGIQVRAWARQGRVPIDKEGALADATTSTANPFPDGWPETLPLRAQRY
jgi:6-pyruvoyltetrahydropterin/6-carboxytetrahydropterin synthase